MYATATHVQQSHFLPQPSLPNAHAYSAVLHHPSPLQPPPLPSPPPPQPQRPPAQQPPAAKEPIIVSAVPSVSIQSNRLVVGNAQSSSTRSYTPLKILGDGSFGTVQLCDWHGTLPPNTPLSPMQCGAGARPEWVGKRLVAVKRMKKKWEGGWDECKKLKELESLRAIPFHPNIIPLYDFFLLPTTKELYFVFESMEGNLYHLIKARKGRPLAGGLVSFIFRQIVSGLDHIHSHGYFHRDMKPENVLVTTTGLFDYQSVSPVAPPNAPLERDVVAIIKLADFGLARETKSEPPYTEYVATRWYRAPEVLLLSRDYSNPVDMWALGTIMAELVNLRPMFPGSGQIEQILRICEVLGDPSDQYGFDKRNKPIGGGKWTRGLKMAGAVGFIFPKIKPKEIHTLFERSVPRSLIDCISDLLRYDPLMRLTSRQCLEHPYLLETIPRNDVPLPKGLHLAPLPFIPRLPPKHSHSSTRPAPAPALPPVPSQIHAPAPQLAPSHIPDASSTHRTPFFPLPVSPASSPMPRTTGPFPSVYPVREAYDPDAILDAHVIGDYDHPMDASPSKEATEDYRNRPTHGQPMDIQESPVLPTRSHDSELHNGVHKVNGNDVQPQANNKLSKLVPFGSKKPSKWGLSGMFGHGDKSQILPPVDEIPAGSSTTSLKRTQSSSTDCHSLPEASDVMRPVDPKMLKKEAERMQREAEKQRRALAEKTQRDQARAVMQKRNQMLQNTITATPDLEWKWHTTASAITMNMNWPPESAPKAKAQTRPVRQTPAPTATATATVNGTHPPAGVPVVTRIVTQTSEIPSDHLRRDNDRSNDNERVAKARRREYDDDHSMSSSDVQRNVRRMSSTSFATVDSDPGPRGRNRPGLFPMSRMTSTSSLRTSFDTHEFLPSTRSSNSISLENQLANDFHNHASMDPSSPLSGSVSPPPVHMLSISPPLSPRPPWMKHTNGNASPLLRSQPHFNHNVMSRSAGVSQHSSLTSPSAPPSPFDFGSQLSGSPNTLCQPPSPGYAPKSAINPIFKVPPLPPLPPLPSLMNGDCLSPPPLPPCSHLEAVAEGEYSPLSPIHFSTTDDGLP